MKKLLKRFFSSIATISLFASLLAVVPVVTLPDSALAATLDNTRFARAKVTSTFKNTGGTAYASCYGSSGTCTMQRSSSEEWSLPEGGYFKLERSINSSWPWRVMSCTFGGSCSAAQSIGRIYAYKPGQYFVYRAPNAAYNWVFSLGFLSPYTFANGSNISWSFDGPSTGREGEYISAPSSVTASINGETTVGSTLSATSTYVGVDAEVTYQWQNSSRTQDNSFSAISGAVNEQYTLTNNDGGKYVRVVITATNFFGATSRTSSNVRISEPPAELDSTFGSVTATLGGFTVNVTNYDSNYNYSATSSAGSVAIGTASGRNLPLTVTGLTSSQNATVTVATTRLGTTDGSGTVSGTSSPSAITTTTGPVGRWIANSISQGGNSFVVADEQGYIYRSTDNGVNWLRLASVQNWSSVAQSNSGNVIVATSAGGNIHISTNSGTTWSEVASVQNWRSIACSATCSTILAAVAGGKLWRSTNRGTSWSEVGVTQPWRSVAISEDGQIMVAAPYNGIIYRSTDAGVTWERETTNHQNSQWTSVAMSTDGAAFFVAAASGKIEASSDFGSFWNEYLNAGDNAAIAYARDDQFLIQCGRNGQIKMTGIALTSTSLLGPGVAPWSSCSVSGDGTKMMATSTTGLIYISTDIGANWSARSVQTGNVNRRALVSNENGTDLYTVVYGGKIQYSADSGATWSTSADITQNWIAIAASNSFQKIYAVGYLGYIYRSVDSGATWQKVNFPKLPWISIAVSADGSKAVAATKGGFIYNTVDSGVSWTPRDQKRKWVSVASSSNGDKFAAVVEGGFVYTSSNSGDSWTQRGSERNWSAIASSSNGNKLVAAVAKGKIYTSSDSGLSWSARATDRNWLNVVSSTSGNKLIAVVGTGKIYTSSNSGSTWTAQENNRNWRALYITGNGNRAYAADFGKKLYRSTDSGENWTAL